ncbi:MAG: hypothetical protein ACRDUY_12900 [Nitriliruptorales bacterium]
MLAGLAGESLTAGGFAVAFFAFGVAAAVLVVLLFAASLGVAVAQEAVVQRVRAAGPTVKRWGGWVLVVIGTWFVALGVFADTFARIFPV